MTYDEIGNPISYKGYSMAWTKAKQLASVSGNGITMSFKYDSNGIRTLKRVNGVDTEFTYAGTTLVSQKTGNEIINFAYTAGGAPYGFTYNGTNYFYLLNLQGDIIGIYDSNGDVVVKYAYDTWGQPMSITGTLADTIGVKNPLRYRGYYYDTETKLYYLQSRYYDPETCHFISMDSYFVAGDYINGMNMYAYCLNNPVMYSDHSGYEAVAAIDYAAFFMSTLSSIIASASPLVIFFGVIALAAIAAEMLVENIVISQPRTVSKTKELADVTVKKAPTRKDYQLAYVGADGVLVKTGSKMTFTEALVALGVTGATNSLSERYKFKIKKASGAVRSLESDGKDWGIYTDSQYSAKALAMVFGSNDPPEVHGSGYYGHYHDSTHSFHIWYGEPLYYNY
ncbi:MAG: RHS repeat-associated core domain-containing protein [Clostridia bacterium]|nr:RHS repeat-associated core domain-containing protein [Clostridia bacterium]